MPEHLGNLLNPRAYPHPVARVELTQTVASWVLVAGDFAYKIARVTDAGTDTPEGLLRRQQQCDEEVRLSRRYTPGLYVGTVRIVGGAEGASVGETGPVLDFATCLRGFDPRQTLDRLVQARAIEPHELALFGRDLSVVHAQLPAASAARAPWSDWMNIRARLDRSVEAAARWARAPQWRDRILELGAAMNRQLEGLATWIEARRAVGRVRECHGELISRNVARLGPRLVAFNCRQDAPENRFTDVAEEVSCLTTDLAGRGRPLHAQEFRNGYLAQSGDYGVCRLLRLHEAHHGLVSANATAADPDECARILKAALAALRPAAPRMILICGGGPAFGRNWLACRLTELLGAVPLDAGDAAPDGAASPGVMRAANDVLAGGYTVIVDVARSRRAQRTSLLELAAQAAVRSYIVDCRARQASAAAGVSGSFEPVAADEAAEIIRLDAEDRGASDAVACRILN
ncbi:MAG TPA: hypothetical protein VMC02_02215 [Steroidobacteraceae bacterium]|nr:hypothetical protein [Steroidobacteraceae bacterium]